MRMSYSRAKSVVVGMVLVAMGLAFYGLPVVATQSGESDSRVAAVPQDMGYGESIVSRDILLFRFMRSWKAIEGGAGDFDPDMDFDGDGEITAADLLTLMGEFEDLDTTPPQVLAYEPSDQSPEDLPWVRFLLWDDVEVDVAGTIVEATVNDEPLDFTRVDHFPTADQIEIRLATPQANGNYEFRVHPKDAAGNWGNWYRATYVLDVDGEPPVVTGSLPPPGSAVPSLETFVVFIHDNVAVDEARTTVNITKNGQTLPSAEYTRDNSVANQVTINFLNPSDGIYQFSVRPYDMAGNPGDATNITIIADNTPPIFLNATVADGDCLRNVPSVSLFMSDNLGIDEAQTMLSIVRDGIPQVAGVDYTRDNSMPDTITVHFTPARNGQYTFTVRPVDIAGNPAAEQTVFSFIADNVPPTVVSTDPPNGAAIPVFATLEVLLADNYVVVEASCSVTATRNGEPFTAFTREDGDNRIDVTIDEPMDAEYQFTIVPMDCAGNMGQVRNVRIISDQTPPELISTIPQSGTYTKTFQSLVINFDDLAGLDHSALDMTVTWNADICDPVLPVVIDDFTVTQLGKNRVQVTLDNLMDGEYRFTYTPVDLVGNAQAPITTVIRRDTTPPTVDAIRIFDDFVDPVEESADNYIRHFTRTRIDLTEAIGLDFAGTSVSIVRNIPGEVIPVAFTRTNGSGCDQYIECTIDDPMDGSYLVLVTARDLAGNITVQQTRQVFADNVPPVVIGSVPMDGGCGDGLSMIYINVLEEVALDLAGSEVEVIRNGEPLVQGTDWALSLVPTGYRITIAEPAEGTYQVSVLARDRAGNVAEETAHFVFYDDAEPARVVSASPESGSIMASFEALDILLEDNIEVDTENTLIEAFKGVMPFSGYTRVNDATQISLLINSPTDGEYLFRITPVDQCMQGPASPYIVAVTADSIPPQFEQSVPPAGSCTQDLSLVRLLLSDNIAVNEASCVVMATRVSTATAMVEGPTADYIVDRSFKDELLLVIFDAVDDNYEFSVVPVDVAGNVGATATVQLRQDSQAPVLLGSTPPDGTIVTEFISATFYFADNFPGTVDLANTTLNVYRDGSPLLPNVHYNRNNTVADQIAITMLTGQLGDGRYDFEIIPRDLCGNVGAIETVVIFQDNVPPVVDQVIPPDGSNICAATEIMILVSDNVAINTEDALVTVEGATGTLVQDVDYTRANGPGVITISRLTPPPSEDASLCITVIPIDVVGNVGDATIACVTSDCTAPIVTGFDPDGQACVASLQWVTVEVQDNLSGVFDVWMEVSGPFHWGEVTGPGSYGKVTGPSQIGPDDYDWLVLNAGSQNATVMLLIDEEYWTAEGYFNVLAQPIDMAGNVGDATTVEILVDDTPPTAYFGFPADGLSACGNSIWGATIADNLVASVTDSVILIESATGYLSTSIWPDTSGDIWIGYVNDLVEGKPLWATNEIVFFSSLNTDATYTVTIIPVDYCGHVGDPVIFTATDDCTPPSVVDVMPAEGCTAVLDTIEILLEDNIAADPEATVVEIFMVTPEGVHELELGDEFTIEASAVPDTAVVTILDPTNGIFVVNIWPIDYAGNVGDPTQMVYFADDGSSPPTATIDPSDGGFISCQTPGWVVEIHDDVLAFSTGLEVSVECATGTLVAGTDYIAPPPMWSEFLPVVLLEPFSTIGAATYIVTATPTDYCGYVGAPVVASATMDCVEPWITMVNPSSGCVSDIQTITVTAGDDMSGVADLVLDITRSGVLLVPDVDYELVWTGQFTTAAQGSIELTAPAEGVYQVVVAPVDVAGNIGMPVSVEFSDDQNPPDEIVTNPADGSLVQTLEVLSAIFNDNTAMDLGNCPVIAVTRDTLPATYTTSIYAVGSGAVRDVTLNWVTDGVYVFDFEQMDACGNAGPPASVTVTADNTAPVLAGVIPATSCVAEVTEITLTITDNLSGIVDIQFDVYRSGALLESPTDYTAMGTGPGVGVLSADVDITIVTPVNGIYEIVLQAEDAAGNVLDTTHVIRVDDMPPAITETYPLSGALTPVNEMWMKLVDDVEVDVAGSILEVTRSGVPYAAGTRTDAEYGATGTITYEIGMGDDGVFEMFVLPIDVCGNVGAGEILTATIDQTPPVITNIVPITTSCITTSNYFVVTATMTDNLAGMATPTVTATYNGTLLTTAPSMTRPYILAKVSVGVAPGSLQSEEIVFINPPMNPPGATLPDGTYTLSFQPIDWAGNLGAVSTVVYHRDTTPPQVDSITPADAWLCSATQWEILVSDSVLFSVTATNVVIETATGVLVSGVDYVRTEPGANSILVALNEPWASATSATYEVTVTPIDYCGNVGAPVVAYATSDCIAPTVEAMYPTGCVATITSVTFELSDNMALDLPATLISVATGNNDVTSTLQIGDDYIVWYDDALDIVGVDILDVTEANYVFSVTPVDMVGNWGSVFEDIITVDNTGPEVMVAMPFADSYFCDDYIEFFLVIGDNLAFDIINDVTVTIESATGVLGATEYIRWDGMVSDSFGVLIIEMDSSWDYVEAATFVVTVTGMDMCGNYFASPYVLSVTQDCIDPIVMAWDPPQGCVANLQDVTVTVWDNFQYDFDATIVSVTEEIGHVATELVEGDDYEVVAVGTDELMISLLAPQEATYTITVIAVDMAWNLSAPDTVVYVNDLTPPVAEVSALSAQDYYQDILDAIHFDITDTIAVDAAGTMVSVMRDGVPLAPVGLPAGFEVDILSNVDGVAEIAVVVSDGTPMSATYVFEVTPVDGCGNLGASVIKYATVDDEAPVMTLDNIADFCVVGVTEVVLNIVDNLAGVEDVEIEMWRVEYLIPTLLVEGEDYFAGFISGEGTLAASYAVTLVTPTDGYYVVNATAYDRVGNIDDETFEFADDNTPPEVGFMLPANGSWVQSVTEIVIGIQDNIAIDVVDDVTVTIETATGAMVIPADYVRVDDIMTDTVTLELQPPWDTILAATFTVTVTGQDMCGNEMAAPYIATVTKDLVAPMIVAATAVPSMEPLPGTEYVDDLDAILVEVDDNYAIFADDMIVAITMTNTASGTVALTEGVDFEVLMYAYPDVAMVTFTNPVNAYYELNLVVVDFAGNMAAPVILDVTKDDEAPTFAGSVPEHNWGENNLTSIVVMIQDDVAVDEAGTVVRITQNGVILNPPQYTLDTSVLNQVTINIQDPTATMEAGYVVNVTMVDMAGNSAFRTLNVYDDRTLPVFVSSSPYQPDNNPTNYQTASAGLVSVTATFDDPEGSSSFAISGLDLLNAPIDVERSGVLLVEDTDWTRTTMPSTKRVRVTLDDPMDGVYKYSFRPLDKAGNLAAATTVLWVTADSIAPTILAATPAHGTIVTTATYNELRIELDDNIKSDPKNSQLTCIAFHSSLGPVPFNNFSRDNTSVADTIIVTITPSAVYTSYSWTVTPRDQAGNFGTAEVLYHPVQD